MEEYSFGLNWSEEVKEHFIGYLQEACEKKGFSFIWISNKNVRSIIRQLESNQLRIRSLLDTEASYNKPKDFYARVCFAVKDGGGIVINDPDRAKISTDKSSIHYELISRGITVPYTVIVRNWEPQTFRLTAEEREKLGVPFVIKPACGYGQLGVIRDAHGTIREIAHARDYDHGDNFLLQEKIVPIQLAGRRAWFRVINVFNTIIPCWWDDHLNLYEHIRYEDFNSYGLFPLVKIVSRIASFTGMVWFSTEIALDKKYGSRRFVAIDYVNDQCDMTTQSESSGGVPDTVVRYTASSIINTVSRWFDNDKASKKYNILLKDAQIEMRGLGYAPT